MSIGPQGFWVQKAGNSEADYEDAFAITENVVAIADGATESSFARAWAESLVRGFTEANASMDAEEAPTGSPADDPWDREAIQRRVTPLQEEWRNAIAWDQLPWFAEDKARSGAFATLLAFRVSPQVTHPPAEGDEADSPDARWRAFAIGDSCMFQIRDGELRTAFPLDNALQFNSRPLLLSSSAPNNDRVWESVAYQEGDCRPGDIFLFATDALAHWFLAEREAGRRPWATLCEVRTETDFSELVTRLRQRHAVRNDDMTLVRMVIPHLSELAAADSEGGPVETPLPRQVSGAGGTGRLENGEVVLPAMEAPEPEVEE